MTSTTTTPLSPTARTRVRRHADRALSDRADLLAILDEAVICHVGVVMGGHPVVLPIVFGVDPDGPDEGGTLYLHGSVAAGALSRSPEQEICVTVTHVDALVLARSAFHHSMNYRSAVVIGRARVVEGEEKSRALSAIVDQVVPGRSATLRDHTKKELAATTVIAVPLYEASVKQRTGGVSDDESDVAAGVWAGVLPLHTVIGEIEIDADVNGRPVPDDVRREITRRARP